MYLSLYRVSSMRFRNHHHSKLYQHVAIAPCCFLNPNQYPESTAIAAARSSTMVNERRTNRVPAMPMKPILIVTLTVLLDCVSVFPASHPPLSRLPMPPIGVACCCNTWYLFVHVWVQSCQSRLVCSF